MSVIERWKKFAASAVLSTALWASPRAQTVAADPCLPVERVRVGAALGNWREWMKCWCPDDYSCKPATSVCPTPLGCVDDYCQKPLPNSPCLAPFGCADNYRGKPWQPGCWRPATNYLCVPLGCPPSTSGR